MDPTTLLMYAHLMVGSIFPQWEQLDIIDRPWAGIRMVLWRNVNTQERVITISGREGIKGALAAWWQRRVGYPNWIADWVIRHQPDTIVGYSGGGGIASWLRGGILFERDPNRYQYEDHFSEYITTVTFNSGRTTFSQHNSEGPQYNVYVRGDFWGDPFAHPIMGPPLPGEYLGLTARPGESTHAMSTIIVALRRLALRVQL